MVSSDSSSLISKHNYFLLIAGLFALSFAVFQISAIFWPPKLMENFGESVKLQTTHPAIFATVRSFLGVLDAFCGLYALSGAGYIRRLPFLRPILVTITAIFLLRSLMTIYAWIIYHKYPELMFIHYLIFSIIDLCVGFIYLSGVIQLFRNKRESKALL